MKIAEAVLLLGDNIKVHFAGAEQLYIWRSAHIGGANYALWTVLPFIAKKFGIKSYGIPNIHGFVPHDIENSSKNAIMDSGLFTIMFGNKNMSFTEKFADRWNDAIAEFVNENKIKSLVVECDCQRLLGVDKAWELRRRLRKEISNRIINVFHLPDGRNGLDRMIEEGDYIALSVPEFVHHSNNYKEKIVYLANYIKNKKPEIDIHLLGCTKMDILKQCNFCTSSDSTSYQSALRYGYYFKNHIDTLSYRHTLPYRKEIMGLLNYYNVETTEKRLDYYSKYAVIANIEKKRYAIFCGGQE
jgi:hypothetical protein